MTNTSSTDIKTCKNCGRTGQLVRDCWRQGGGAYDNSTSNNSNTQKGKNHKKAKAKANKWTLWKRICLLKQLQPCRILHKHWVQLENSRAIQTRNRKVRSWVRQSIPCPQRDKLLQSVCFLTAVHSFALVRSRIQDKKNRRLILDSTASGARLQHDGGRLVTQTSRMTNNSSAFPRVCSTKTNSVPWLSRSAGYSMIFAEALVHCSLLTRSRRNTAKHSCTRKRDCSLSKGCWLRPCRQLV